jgi:hypothetical protein
MLPEKFMPPQELMIRWVAEVERIEQNNHKTNLALQKLLRLFRDECLRPIVLKGQSVAAMYETFVADARGQIISNIASIAADKKGNELVHKVTYSLSSTAKFQKDENYFVILRYMGSDTNVVMKAPCEIVIEFASDFDF